jgi:hypothetical protein
MQTNHTNQLLSALSGARTNAAARSAQPAAPISGTPFDELLEEARTGAATGASPVKLAKGLDLKLNEDQLARVAAAVDLAQANGAGRVMVLVDGRALQVDVGTRTILGEVTGAKTASMPGVDAVVNAPASKEALDAAAQSRPVPPPSASPLNVANTALRSLLESR